MIHDLKYWPEPFQAIWTGKKTHEVRVNDRGYAVGDFLHLHEWRPDTADQSRGSFTGRRLRVEVTYISAGGQFELPDNLCVMSIVTL